MSNGTKRPWPRNHANAKQKLHDSIANHGSLKQAFLKDGGDWLKDLLLSARKQSLMAQTPPHVMEELGVPANATDDVLFAAYEAKLARIEAELNTPAMVEDDKLAPEPGT